MAFNLDDYEPVADRIERFWTDHKAGRILTEMVHRDEKSFIVKASVYRDEVGDADATGYAEEIIGSTNVNRTSALENCETSAIGRALANLGYAVKNRASREEMAKAQPAPRQRSGQKRTPTPPEPTESHKKAPQADLEPDIAAEVKRLKNWAFKQLGGDVDRTKQIWAEVLATYDLKPDDLPLKESIQFIEADLSLEIGKALVGELVQPELVAEDERPFENAV